MFAVSPLEQDRSNLLSTPPLARTHKSTFLPRQQTEIGTIWISTIYFYVCQFSEYLITDNPVTALSLSGARVSFSLFLSLLSSVSESFFWLCNLWISSV